MPIRKPLVPMLFSLILFAATSAAETLPSWRPGPARDAVIDFVGRVANPTSPDFVSRSERIAVFDNDGTLWSEKPLYFQLRFAIDRIKRLAPQHPEWRDRQPFKAVLEDDHEALAAGGEKGLLQIVTASHSGMTTQAFADAVKDWLRTARHPRFHRPYTDLVYQPMLELLAYLRGNGFKTYIVSGGGIEFMRVFAEEVYGVPPEQVIGSSIQTRYEMHNGRPVIVRLPEIDFINDKEGKPIGIHRFIGRRPIAAFGNSDGDFEMLAWTTSGAGPRFGLLVHHTDAEREWAYDRKSHVGRLERGLREGPGKGWIVVDMANDWETIFPFEKK